MVHLDPFCSCFISLYNCHEASASKCYLILNIFFCLKAKLFFKNVLAHWPTLQPQGCEETQQAVEFTVRVYKGEPGDSEDKPKN